MICIQTGLGVGVGVGVSVGVGVNVSVGVGVGLTLNIIINTMAVMLSAAQRQKIRSAASAVQREVRRQRSGGGNIPVSARQQRQWL